MRYLRLLYVQVLLGILLGIGLGGFYPQVGVTLKPLGDAFVSLIKMLVTPIIFLTVVVGLVSKDNLPKAGRLGWRALLYFEVITTFALIIGLVVANVFQPGVGLQATLDAKDVQTVAGYTSTGKQGLVDTLVHIIPKTFFSAFVEGDTLQILLIAVLFGIALGRLGKSAEPLVHLMQKLSEACFGMVKIVTYLAPVAAAAAMAFTVGKYGFHTLSHLGQLILCVYLTTGIFIFVVLGLVAAWGGFSLWKILKYLREEIFVVIGTSSSESALPRLMEKLEKAGCHQSSVGLLVPAGYSFNLDGTCIYLTMAALFIAQATQTPLTLAQQVSLLLILLVTSKGAAGVTGSGLITLAVTLSTVGTIPVEGIALIIGVDRFMSEARAVTNFIGNAVATFVISRWSGDYDETMGRAVRR
jgi:aerobic C4-dicarboxylate transport protein